MAQYDVFVSYNGDDREWAEQFANELHDLGVRVWFDQWELRAGQTWMDTLESAIQESASVAILVGQAGLGPWEQVELRQALSNLVQHRCPVIPVILPGVERFELPPFLRQCQYIDYRDRQTYLKRMEKMVLGITGRKLTHAISQVGDTFRLELPKGRTIIVRTLPNPNAERRLFLTWETFGQGIEYLRDQIRTCVPRLAANACIGIQEAGLVIASFLYGSVMGRGGKVGYVKTEGTPQREIVEADSWLPDPKKLPNEPLILLTDSEIKSGSDLETVVERVRAEYPKASIYYAVLAAMASGSNPKIASFDQLMAKAVLERLNLRDLFIAFTMIKPGIEPPLEVR